MLTAIRTPTTLTREELYERVWTTSVVQLAKEFGISDVGLAKACERHGIPRPPPGYWTREHRARRPLSTGARPSLVVFGHRLQVRVRELTRREPHVPTPKELAEQAKYSTVKRIPKWDYLPCGDFTCEVLNDSGTLIVVVHHTTKGGQGQKAVTDVGSGGGAQSRAADTHLVLRHHEEPGAVVVEAAVRSWTHLPPFVIRWANPGWELAPNLDATALQQPSFRKKKAAPAAEVPAAPVRQWSVEEFAREVVGPTPKIKEDILAMAIELGLSKSQATGHLKRAEEAKLVHRVVGPDSRHRFTTEPSPQQELPTSGEGGGEGDVADDPHPRSFTLRGGVGGSARPPSPPSPTPDLPEVNPEQRGAAAPDPAPPGTTDYRGGEQDLTPSPVAPASWASAADLPPDLREEYDERAAIMEFDGNLPRERAEALAFARSKSA